MLRNIIGPVFNFRNCVLCCCLFWLVFQTSSSFCRENEIFENKKINNKKMDQFLTLKRANLGPMFNFTACIYIYIYVYVYTHIQVFGWNRNHGIIAVPNPGKHLIYAVWLE